MYLWQFPKENVLVTGSLEASVFLKKIESHIAMCVSETNNKTTNFVDFYLSEIKIFPLKNP